MNGVLVVDKAAGPTSHDVVRFARRAFGVSKVGHAGTLDPFATGVLVLAVGEGTKLVAALTTSDKEYEGVLRLGTETDTLDPDGQVVAHAVVPSTVDLQAIRTAATRFVGRILQSPPAASAVHVDGARAYERFRRGETVELEPREVLVHDIVVVDVVDHDVSFRVRSSKGFYVRAFGRDLAKALGTVGHLRALRRTQSGPFGIDRAVTLDRLFQAKQGDSGAKREVTSALLSLDQAWSDRPRVVVAADALRRVADGKAIAVDHLVDHALPVVTENETVGMFSAERHMVGLAQRVGDELRVVRGIRELVVGAAALSLGLLCGASNAGCAGDSGAAPDVMADTEVEREPDLAVDVPREMPLACAPACDPAMLCCATATGESACAEVLTDVRNCGDCAIDCTMGRGVSCRAGQCVCGTSPGGCKGGVRSTCCQGLGSDPPFCANLDSEAEHCGACDFACDLMQADRCIGGECNCGIRRRLCSGTADERCCPKSAGEAECTNTTNDSLNCGECGRICPLSETCRGGICQSP